MAQGGKAPSFRTFLNKDSADEERHPYSNTAINYHDTFFQLQLKKQYDKVGFEGWDAGESSVSKSGPPL